MSESAQVSLIHDQRREHHDKIYALLMNALDFLATMDLPSKGSFRCFSNILQISRRSQSNIIIVIERNVFCSYPRRRVWWETVGEESYVQIPDMSSFGRRERASRSWAAQQLIALVNLRDMFVSLYSELCGEVVCSWSFAVMYMQKAAHMKSHLLWPAISLQRPKSLLHQLECIYIGRQSRSS